MDSVALSTLGKNQPTNCENFTMVRHMAGSQCSWVHARKARMRAPCICNLPESDDYPYIFPNSQTLKVLSDVFAAESQHTAPAGFTFEG